MARHNRLRGLSAAFVLASSPILAQTVTANVTGNITDPSGAVIPNAKVTVHNVDTGVDTTTTTDTAGLYRVQFLPYRPLHAKCPGPRLRYKDRTPRSPWKLCRRQPSTWRSRQAAGLKPSMFPRPLRSWTPATPTLSGTFTANTIQNFPLNGLDFSALTLYVPGSVSTARHQWHAVH